MYMIRRNNELGNWMNLFNDTFNEKAMKVDIVENEKDYQITCDVPGVDKKDVSINVEDGYVTVSVTRNDEHEEKEGKKFIRRERHFESVSRSFYVGDVDADAIKAKLENGTLNISVAKAAKLESKKTIAIE